MEKVKILFLVLRPEMRIGRVRGDEMTHNYFFSTVFHYYLPSPSHKNWHYNIYPPPFFNSISWQITRPYWQIWQLSDNERSECHLGPKKSHPAPRMPRISQEKEKKNEDVLCFKILCRAGSFSWSLNVLFWRFKKTHLTIFYQQNFWIQIPAKCLDPHSVKPDPKDCPVISPPQHTIRTWACRVSWQGCRQPDRPGAVPPEPWGQQLMMARGARWRVAAPLLDRFSSSGQKTGIKNFPEL